MSFPRRTTSHSSSRSKSSLKTHQGPSGGLLPSPHFEEPQLDEALPGDEAIKDDAVAEKSVQGFQPFFTLIQTPSTSEYHHPTVHYIFADDDAELITEAACRALTQEEIQSFPATAEEDAKLPRPLNGVREHYILLDVQPDDAGSGYEVTRASSLSSEWQVMNSSISTAPTIDDTDPESGEGLMLKIEGMGAISETESGEAGRNKEKESLQNALGRFEKGLADIRRMVAGESK
jgi:hypothetical protein